MSRTTEEQLVDACTVLDGLRPLQGTGVEPELFDRAWKIAMARAVEVAKEYVAENE